MLLFFALLLPISMVAMEQNNGVFSFKLQDVTVKDIFKYIEKNSEYIFLYSTDKNLLKKLMWMSIRKILLKFWMKY